MGIKLNITPSYIGKSNEELSQGARRALAANIIANLGSATANPALATDAAPSSSETLELPMLHRSEESAAPFEFEFELPVALPVEQEVVIATRVSQWQSSLSKVDRVFAAEADPMFDFLLDADSQRSEQSIQEAIKEAYAILDVASVSQRDERFHENLFRITEALKAVSPAQEHQKRNNVLFVTSENLKRPA